MQKQINHTKKISILLIIVAISITLISCSFISLYRENNSNTIGKIKFALLTPEQVSSMTGITLPKQLKIDQKSEDITDKNIYYINLYLLELIVETKLDFIFSPYNDCYIKTDDFIVYATEKKIVIDLFPELSVFEISDNKDFSIQKTSKYIIPFIIKSTQSLKNPKILMSINDILISDDL